MGTGQHQRWAASGKQRAASGGKWLAAGGQQGGDITCLLIGHGRGCCFVALLRCQPLTDGICDDVLDVVEGIAGEIVIKLTQEEKGVKGKIWFRLKNVYLRWNQKDVTDQKISCAEGHCR
jgi:hypothetical protein